MKIKNKILQDVLNILSTQTDEANVRTGDGWRIYARSADSTALVDVNISTNAFDEYVVYDPFKIDIAKTLSALKHMGEQVSVEIDGRLILSDGHMTYRLPLYPADEQIAKIPDFQIEATVMIDQDLVRRFFASADYKLTSQVEFSVEDGVFTIATLDETDCGLRVDYTMDDCLDIEGRACTCYNLDMWNDFTKVFPKGVTVELGFTDDMPIRMDFEGDSYKGVWLLAPIINEE